MSATRFSAARSASRSAGSPMKNDDRIEPRVDRCGIGQRRHQPLGEQPRAAAGHGAVDRLEQRAVALARQRAQQFEIGARRRVDEQRRARLLALGPRQRRPLGLLRLLDIGDDAGRSPTVRRARKRRSRPASRRRRSARCGPAPWPNRTATAGCGLATRPSTSNTGFSSAIVEHRLGDDQFARVDAEDVGEQPRRRRSRRRRKAPVEISIQASAKASFAAALRPAPAPSG